MMNNLMKKLTYNGFVVFKTSSTGQSPSWKGNNLSALKKFLAIYGLEISLPLLHVPKTGPCPEQNVTKPAPNLISL
jgi:hypothetical protein